MITAFISFKVLKIVKQFLFLPFLLLIFNAFSQPVQKGVIEVHQEKLSSGKIWAVIVGVSKYQNIQSLRYADKDAFAFFEYLKSTGKIPLGNIQLIVNEGAVSSEIYGALEWLRESVQANDRVIFYFSGHGDVEKKTIHQNGFLLAHDAPVAAYMTKGTISTKFLQDYLETYVAVNHALNVTVIIDACKSGKLAGGMEGIQITMQALGERWNNQIVKILSSQEGELSYEDTKWGGGRGVFSYYLLKGIQGFADRNKDSLINASELALYLPGQVADATNNLQNPKIEGNIKEILFTYNYKLLKDAKNKNNDTSSQFSMIASRGKILELDSEIVKLYGEYNQYLKEGRLVIGREKNDSVLCALHVYTKLITLYPTSSIIPSLKSSFLTALQKKSQLYLDEYINGENYLHFKRNKEALKEMRCAKNLINSSHILYNYITSRLYFLESAFIKDPNEAIELLKKALSIEDEAPYIFNRLGARYSDLKQYDSAIFYYNKAISFSPQWSFPYTNLGIVYRQLKEYDKAINYYQSSLTLNPKSSLAYYNLGITYRHMTQYEKAIYNYLRSIELDSTNPSVYNNLALAYGNIGKRDIEIENLKKAIALDTNYINGYYNLAGVYAIIHDKEKGMFYLTQALQKGYKNYKNLTEDISLEFIRKENEFQKLINKYFPEK